MTQRTLSSIIFTVIFSLATSAAIAGGHTAKTESHTSSFPDSHPKAPHSKLHAPQMEELPHIHKFHKERVKKIKKHHGKYWFLSQVILALCHISILIIGYLHATH